MQALSKRMAGWFTLRHGAIIALNLGMVIVFFIGMVSINPQNRLIGWPAPLLVLFTVIVAPVFALYQGGWASALITTVVLALFPVALHRYGYRRFGSLLRRTLGGEKGWAAWAMFWMLVMGYNVLVTPLTQIMVNVLETGAYTAF